LSDKSTTKVGARRTDSERLPVLSVWSVPTGITVCRDLSLGVHSEGDWVERFIANFVEFGLPQARGPIARNGGRALKWPVDP